MGKKLCNFYIVNIKMFSVYFTRCLDYSIFYVMIPVFIKDSHTLRLKFWVRNEGKTIKSIQNKQNKKSIKNVYKEKRKHCIRKVAKINNAGMVNVF